MRATACALVIITCPLFGQSTVADGMSGLSGALGELANTMAERQKHRDVPAGETAAIELLTAHALVELVQGDMLPKDKSGWFKLGFYEQAGQMMADRAHDARLIWEGQDPTLSTTTDLSAWDSRLIELNKSWVAANIPPEMVKNDYFQSAFAKRDSEYWMSERGEEAERINAHWVQKFREERRDSIGRPSLADEYHTYSEPEVDEAPQHSCPAWAQSHRFEGLSNVDFVVTKDGEIEPGSVFIPDHEELLETVKAFLARCSFMPGQVKGRPVDTRTHLLVDFKPDES